MIRNLVVLTAAAVGIALVPAVGAEAATNSAGGVRVTTPSSVTAYNHGKASVRPKVTVRSGVHKAVTSVRITAYAGRHKVASGTRVKLRAGKYTVRTYVKYRTYKLVTKTRVVRTAHDPDDGFPPNVDCTVTSIVSHDPADPYNDVVEAGCTSSHYPGEVVPVTGCNSISCMSWCPDEIVGSPAAPTVGQVFHNNSCAPKFAPYYTTTTQHYLAKQWISYGHYTTPRRKLTVRDGGYRRVYSDNQSLTTSYFTVHSNWTAHYSYNCGTYTGNWIVDLHRAGTSVLDDKYLSNVIRHGGSGTWHFSSPGKYRFEIITECDWTLTVRAKR